MEIVLRIDRLDWDAWDLAHIAKHGVTEGQVREIVFGDGLIRETYKN